MGKALCIVFQSTPVSRAWRHRKEYGCREPGMFLQNYAHYVTLWRLTPKPRMKDDIRFFFCFSTLNGNRQVFCWNFWNSFFGNASVVWDCFNISVTFYGKSKTHFVNIKAYWVLFQIKAARFIFILYQHS